jgi:integrase
LTKQWPELKKQLQFLGKNLTKWNLVKAITILSEARKSRFLRRKTPKYGSMNKSFTDEELERFFNMLDDPKMHMLFSFQAIIGLRIGEAIRVNIKDINLRTRELRIFTEKSGKTDYLLIPIQFFDRVIKYIDAYEKEIAKAKGHLFFSLEPGHRTQNTALHITTHTARTVFQKCMRKAKLDEIYGYTSGTNPKPLYRLTPHSLRHYAITNFCRKNGGNVMLASKFARHTNLQTTMVYIHAEKNELYESIERAQDDRLMKKIKEMQEATKD